MSYCELAVETIKGLLTPLDERAEHDQVSRSEVMRSDPCLRLVVHPAALKPGRLLD